MPVKVLLEETKTFPQGSTYRLAYSDPAGDTTSFDEIEAFMLCVIQRGQAVFVFDGARDMRRDVALAVTHTMVMSGYGPEVAIALADAAGKLARGEGPT